MVLRYWFGYKVHMRVAIGNTPTHMVTKANSACPLPNPFMPHEVLSVFDMDGQWVAIGYMLIAIAWCWWPCVASVVVGCL